MSYLSHRRTRAVLAPAAIAACALACSAAPAMADTMYACTQPGAGQTITVPSGAVSASVNLQGGAGGSTPFAAGGRGANLNVTTPVTPGQTLTVQVACQGTGAGFGGPGAASGGGATILSSGSTQLAVAAGGGGAGGQQGPSGGGYGAGGAGGNADSSGSDGSTIRDPSYYAGGGGQSGDAGGAGGAGGDGSSVARREPRLLDAGRERRIQTR